MQQGRERGILRWASLQVYYSQQRSAFESLTATLIDFFNVRLTSAAEREALAVDDNSITSTDGRFSVSVVDVRGFLQVGQLCSNFFLSLCYLNII